MLQVVEHVTAQGQRSRRSVGIGSPHILQSMTAIVTPYTLYLSSWPKPRRRGTRQLCSCRRGRRPQGRTALADLPSPVGSGSVNYEPLAKVHGLTTMIVRLQTEALDVRRVQLPRIRLKALEEPDFVEIGLNNATQDGRRGPPSGRGGVPCYLSRQRIAPVRGHARQWAHSGIEHQLGTPCVQSVRPHDGGSLEVRTWWARPV